MFRVSLLWTGWSGKNRREFDSKYRIVSLYFLHFPLAASNGLSVIDAVLRMGTRSVRTIIIDNPPADTFRFRRKCNENTHAINKHINLLLLHRTIYGLAKRFP